AGCPGECSYEPSQTPGTEGNCSRWRLGNAAASGDDRGFEATAPGVRQADDLLSADHADACWDSRYPRGVDAPGYAALRTAPRRRKPLGPSHRIRRAAESGWYPPGLSPGRD